MHDSRNNYTIPILLDKHAEANFISLVHHVYGRDMGHMPYKSKEFNLGKRDQDLKV